MEAIIANFKVQLSAVISAEVEKTLGLFRSKIVKALNVEDTDDLKINMTKIISNTTKKIMDSEVFANTEEELKKKSPKKEKIDPDAPKAAVNSFILFCRDNRDKIKEKNPEMKAIDITKKLAEMWKDLEDEEKKEYQEKSKEDKERYVRELEDYEPKEGFKNPKKSPSPKKPSSPKRSLSSYIFFCNDKREEIKKNNPEMKTTEIMAEMGKLWKVLSDKKKKPYEDKAAEDKKRYEEEMKNYVPEEGSKKKKTKSGSLSSYILFCKDNYNKVKTENPTMKGSDIMKNLAVMWKSLNEDEKKVFTEKAEKLKESKKNEDDKVVQEEEEVKKSPKKVDDDVKSPKKSKDVAKNKK
jgi:hypothetical protein